MGNAGRQKGQAFGHGLPEGVLLRTGRVPERSPGSLAVRAAGQPPGLARQEDVPDQCPVLTLLDPGPDPVIGQEPGPDLVVLKATGDGIGRRLD